MLNKNVARRMLGTGAVAVALVTVALGATGCSSASKAYVPAEQPATAATAPAQATPPVAAAPAAAPAAAAPAAKAANTPAQGQEIVQKSCVGRCHGSKLVEYRASQTQAERVVSSMAPKAGLSDSQQVLVVQYFAQ